MSDSDKHDPLQQYLSGDDGLSSAYARTRPGNEPPAAVDDAVLQAARAQIKKPGGNVVMFPRRWMAPLAAAATLVLVVGVSQWFGGPAEIFESAVLDKAAPPIARAPLPADRRERSVVSAPATKPVPKVVPSLAVPGTRQDTALRHYAPPHTADDSLRKSAPTITGAVGRQAPASSTAVPGASFKAKQRMNEKIAAGADQKKSDIDKFQDTRAQAQTRILSEEKEAVAKDRDIVAKRFVYRQSPHGPGVTPATRAARPAQAPGDAKLGHIKIIDREHSARAWAQRLNIPYHPLAEGVWARRLQQSREQWLRAVRDALAANDMRRARAELAALAAVHGAVDPQIPRYAARLRGVAVPATK